MSYVEHLAAHKAIERDGFRCKPVNNFGKYGVKVWEGGSPRIIWTKQGVCDLLNAASWSEVVGAGK